MQSVREIICCVPYRENILKACVARGGLLPPLLPSIRCWAVSIHAFSWILSQTSKAAAFDTSLHFVTLRKNRAFRSSQSKHPKNHACHSNLSTASVRRHQLHSHGRKDLRRVRPDMFPANSLPSRTLVNAIALRLGNQW